jgi:hypothetical protein
MGNIGSRADIYFGVVRTSSEAKKCGIFFPFIGALATFWRKNT